MSGLNLQSVIGLSRGECKRSELSKCDWSSVFGSVNGLSLGECERSEPSKCDSSESWGSVSGVSLCGVRLVQNFRGFE